MMVFQSIKSDELRGVTFLFALLAIILFSSCEEVIDADLSKSEAVIVIEGSVSDQSEFHTVKVSKTIDFSQPNSFNGVNGAKVTVYSSNNETFIFTQSATAGVYRSPRFRGISGVNYTLEVIAEGKTYKASSIMPIAVRPDSLTFRTLTFFGNSRVYPAIYYRDPAKIQNHYRYIIKVNNVLAAEQVSEDRFSDGNPTSELLAGDGEGIKSGDKVDVEIQCIDRNVFKYFFAITQIGGNGGPPVAPSNPETNLDNGALGIFSANTRATFTLTLK